MTSQCPACHGGEIFSPFLPPAPLPYQIQAGSAKSLAGGTLAERQFSDTPQSILHPNPCVVWFTTLTLLSADKRRLFWKANFFSQELTEPDLSIASSQQSFSRANSFIQRSQASITS